MRGEKRGSPVSVWRGDRETWEETERVWVYKGRRDPIRVRDGVRFSLTPEVPEGTWFRTSQSKKEGVVSPAPKDGWGGYSDGWSR